jgi:hypothetical protein
VTSSERSRGLQDAWCGAARARLTDLEAAWSEIHDAKLDGWFVGTPVYIERRGWERYAFDRRERAKAGHRSRKWTAVANSELEVVREMARCLRLIAAGDVPR